LILAGNFALLLISDQNDEVSDTTGADRSTTDGSIKIMYDQYAGYIVLFDRLQNTRHNTHAKSFHHPPFISKIILRKPSS